MNKPPLLVLAVLLPALLCGCGKKTFADLDCDDSELTKDALVKLKPEHRERIRDEYLEEGFFGLDRGLAGILPRWFAVPESEDTRNLSDEEVFRVSVSFIARDVRDRMRAVFDLEEETTPTIPPAEPDPDPVS
ncbi:MAG: hypothetical protein LBR95_08195 [Azoarcus sp.]|jgi:hypothetical protein|nr:hypothetical protein [Azoarcus sp.]